MATPDPRDWLVPFTWHGVDNNNRPATGIITAIARALQISAPDATDPIRVYTSPQSFLIVDGVCTGALLASDYPGNSNQHFTWYITEEITNGTGVSYDIEVPISMQQNGILLSAYAPTQPTSGLPTSMVSRAEFDALVRRVDDLQGISSGDGELIRMTFDDGIEGALMPVGGYITNVIGNVRYKAAASKYVTGLGLALNGPAGDWGNFSVLSPNGTAADWQFYLRIKTVGNAQAHIGEFQNALTGSTGMGTLGLKTGRSLALNPPEGIEGGGVSSAALPLNTWIRLDIRVENDGTTSTYTVIGYWLDAEGNLADMTITNSWAGPATDKIKWGLGSGEKTWSLDLDTMSFKAGVEALIPAYSPSLPVWIHEFEAANDRTMAPGDIGLEDATAAVGCQSLIGAVKHGTRGLRTTAGYVEYPIRNLAGNTGSVYLNRRTAGGSPSPFIDYMVGAASVGSIRMKTGASQNITLSDNTGTTKVTAAAASMTTGQWWRADYSHAWTPAAGGTLTLTVRINYPPTEAGEGTTYETLTTTYTGVGAPTSVRIGFSGAGWVGDIDSHRSNPNSTDHTIWAPVAPPQTQAVTYSLTGLTGATTAVVKAVLTGYATMNLGWSTTADASGNLTGTVTYLGAKTPDAHGMVSWNITGLSPGVPRYFKLTPDGASTYVGDPMTITARPADNTAFSNWRIAYMSCQSAVDGTPQVSGVVYEPTWADSLAWKANELWFTGDGGYWGSKIATTDTPWDISQRWVGWLSSMVKQRAACANAPSRWMKDDHEVGPANLDSNVDPGKSTVEKLHNNEGGMPYIFPFYPLTGALQSDSYGSYRRSLFGWEMFTSRIRIVYLDAYCMERSAALMTDTSGAGFGHLSNGSEKTWLGVEQDTLLENLLSTGTQPPLTLFVCGKTFLGRQQGPVIMNDYDKIWNYPSWRIWFGNLINTYLPGKAVWLGGDRHLNAYAPASMNPWANMPCWISSGTCMHNLGPTTGEVGTGTGKTEGYTLLDPTNYKASYQKTTMTYVRYTLSDNNAGQITFTGQSRYNQNDWDGVHAPDGVTAGAEETHWPTWVAAGIKNGFTATNTFSY